MAPLPIVTSTGRTSRRPWVVRRLLGFTVAVAAALVVLAALEQGSGQAAPVGPTIRLGSVQAAHHAELFARWIPGQRLRLP